MLTTTRCVARAAAAGLLALAGTHALPQGVPVYDNVANLNFLRQLLHMVEQLSNQVEQIRQMQLHYHSITGYRGFGGIYRNRVLDDYVPLDAVQRTHAVALNGYAGLSAAARVLRDATMTYNCLDQQGERRLACQSMLARPYESQALLRQAITTSNSRIGYVNGLIDAIRQTTDPKMVGELQARIEGENALLAHESTRIQLLQQQLENDRQVELSRLHERTNANLDLPTRLPALAAH